MIHYVYKIIFLVGSLSGHYYIGKRSYNGDNIDNDTYCGSGKICDDYFKKHKKILNETYKKEVLKICETEEEAYLEEEIILGDLFKTDILCEISKKVAMVDSLLMNHGIKARRGARLHGIKD